MNKRTGRGWPWFVVAILVTTAAAQGVMVWQATHDPTFAVESDYYMKAVGWDSAMARERANLDLGWRATVEATRDSAARPVLVVRLRDREGNAVAGARVRAVAIHNLDAAHPTVVALAESGEAYRGPLARARPGMWEVRIDAHARGVRFTPTVRVEYTP